VGRWVGGVGGWVGGWVGVGVCVCGGGGTCRLIIMLLPTPLLLLVLLLPLLLLILRPLRLARVVLEEREPRAGRSSAHPAPDLRLQVVNEGPDLLAGGWGEPLALQQRTHPFEQLPARLGHGVDQARTRRLGLQPRPLLHTRVVCGSGDKRSLPRALRARDLGDDAVGMSE
jgi:hypothetical protein